LNACLAKECRAIVADDDDDLRGLMACALGRAGFSVSQARDGIELLAMACAQTGSEVLVVSDIAMPRVDGIAATQSLRETTPDVPIVLVTACQDAATLERAESAGADRVLLKPLDLSELVDVAIHLTNREGGSIRLPRDPLRSGS
jgi:two-component system OmpR family response regulator